MQKITVWMDEDYTKSHTFYVPQNWTIGMIRDEVNNRYDDWYSFDIW